MNWTPKGLALAVLAASALARPAASAPSAEGIQAPAPRVVAGAIEERWADAGLAQEIRALASGRGDPIWIAWSVPLVQGERRICCFGDLAGPGRKPSSEGRCDLEDDDGFTITSEEDDPTPRPRASWLHVLVRASREGVTRVRGFSEDCRLDPGGRAFHRLTGVTPAESLKWLESRLAPRRRGEEAVEREDDILAVVALHGAPEADGILEAIALGDGDADLRGHALFWMAGARGRRGFETVRRVATRDRDAEVRRKAIFALSQSREREAIEAMIGLARGDRDPDARGEALFWLAQAAGRKVASEAARRAISDAVENDPETEVKKKAVFALSQLPSEDGVPLLLDVARTHRNPEVRREAIFWLGQSDDPRALELIQRILES